MNLNKIALFIGIVCIILGTTISILGIWGYIGGTGLIFRSLATLGVVLLGVVLSVAINKLISSDSEK